MRNFYYIMLHFNLQLITDSHMIKLRVAFLQVYHRGPDVCDLTVFNALFWINAQMLLWRWTFMISPLAALSWQTFLTIRGGSDQLADQWGLLFEGALTLYFLHWQATTESPPQHPLEWRAIQEEILPFNVFSAIRTSKMGHQRGHFECVYVFCLYQNTGISHRIP